MNCACHHQKFLSITCDQPNVAPSPIGVKYKKHVQILEAYLFFIVGHMQNIVYSHPHFILFLLMVHAHIAINMDEVKMVKNKKNKFFSKGYSNSHEAW